ncbi:MAG: hypothetical protein P9L94_11680 [Candidatus Hinthialibacter antarcticus]|nr:hypothetical protein [Candidatus Hinthialibacter antarcticus]
MTYSISQQRRGSLQRQIIVWVNAALIALTIMALTYDYYAQKRILTANFHASMLQAASHISLALKNSQNMESATNTLSEYCKVMSRHDDPYHTISLIDSTGETVVSSKNKQTNESKTDGSNIVKGLFWNSFQQDGDTYSVLSMPFENKWPNNDFVGMIQYIENDNSIDMLLSHLFWNRAYLLVIIVFIISVIIFVILKVKVLTPLDRIFVQSYAVSTGDYSIWHVPDPGNELGDIQSMFNFMITNIREHEKFSINKMRESTIIELLSQVYHSVVTSSSRINAACDNISNNQSSLRDTQINVRIVKNECQKILDDLSELIEMKDSAPKNVEKPTNPILED